MNERDISQTPNTENIQPTLNELIDKVVVQERTADDPFQQVYLPPNKEGNARTGYVTGVGELRNANNELMYDAEQNVRLVGEVTYVNEAGEQRIAKGELSNILAIDAGIREKRASERERQATLSKKLGGLVFRNEQALPVLPESLPPHPDDELRDAVRREAVQDAGLIEVPRAFVPVDSTARDGQVDHRIRNVPLDHMPSNPTTVIGSPYNPETPAIQAYGELLNDNKE